MKKNEVATYIMLALAIVLCLMTLFQSARVIQIGKDTLQVVNRLNAEAYGATEPVAAEDEMTMESLGVFKVTHYCACNKCTNGAGVTASGTVPEEGRTCAAEGLPIGTHLLIAATGEILTVEDRFGDVSKVNCVDIYVRP